jgi:hypothetical protein
MRLTPQARLTLTVAGGADLDHDIVVPGER